MGILLDSQIIQGVGNDFLMSLGAAVVSLVGGYIIIRERILKTELKTNAMTDYIDGKYRLLENKIAELQEDITEFKMLNKETAKSLTENTAAIRELKAVMYILKEQLGVKAQRKVRAMSDGEIEIPENDI